MLATALVAGGVYLALALALASSQAFGRNNVLFGADQAEYVWGFQGNVGKALISAKHPLGQVMVWVLGVLARGVARPVAELCGLGGLQLAYALASASVGAASVWCFGRFCLLLGLGLRRSVLVSLLFSMSAGNIMWSSALEIHSLCGLGLCGCLAAYRARSTWWHAWIPALVLVGANITGVAYLLACAADSVRFGAWRARAVHISAVMLVLGVLFVVQAEVWSDGVAATLQRESAASTRYLATPRAFPRRVASAAVHQAVFHVILPQPRFVAHWPRAGEPIEGIPFVTTWRPSASPLYWVFASTWGVVLAVSAARSLGDRRMWGIIACMGFNLALFSVFGLPQEQMLYAPMVLPLSMACVASALAGGGRVGAIAEAGVWMVLPGVVVFNAQGFSAILAAFAP